MRYKLIDFLQITLPIASLHPRDAHSENCCHTDHYKRSPRVNRCSGPGKGCNRWASRSRAATISASRGASARTAGAGTGAGAATAAARGAGVGVRRRVSEDGSVDLIPEAADRVVHNARSCCGRSIKNIEPYGGISEELRPQASRIAARHSCPEPDELPAERVLGLGEIAVTSWWRVVVCVTKDIWDFGRVGCPEDW